MSKNSHMMHLEDSVIYGGVTGARNAINGLRSLRDMLAGESKQSVDVTRKWDGAPAVFIGVDPNDGKFFVAKKGIFNKSPVVYKSHKDIDADVSGDLANKLKVSYTEFKKLGLKAGTVLQGDLMFTSDTLKNETIDGKKYVTFHPNTIVYAVPAFSDEGKRIKKAKIGVVWHTTYTGDSFESMTANFRVNMKALKDIPSVWQQSAKLHDLSGTAVLTRQETDRITKLLSRAGTIFQKISGNVLREIESNQAFARMIEQFNNTFVRKGEVPNNSKKHVQDMISWIHELYAKEAEKRKTEKGKAGVAAKRDRVLSFFSPSNQKNLEKIFDLQRAIVEVKLVLIQKLDELDRIPTFIKTKNGFKVTGSEGFVAIDTLSDGAVKLVDRLEFSTNNFNPDILKGWDK